MVPEVFLNFHYMTDYFVRCGALAQQVEEVSRSAPRLQSIMLVLEYFSHLVHSGCIVCAHTCYRNAILFLCQFHGIFCDLGAVLGRFFHRFCSD